MKHHVNKTISVPIALVEYIKGQNLSLSRELINALMEKYHLEIKTEAKVKPNGTGKVENQGQS